MTQSEEENKLDNPVWFSASETHQPFALSYDTIKFYHPDYCSFGGFISSVGISAHIDTYAKMTNNFFVVGEKPPLSKQLTLKNELVCVQMMMDHTIELASTET